MWEKTCFSNEFTCNIIHVTRMIDYTCIRSAEPEAVRRKSDLPKFKRDRWRS